MVLNKSLEYYTKPYTKNFDSVKAVGKTFPLRLKYQVNMNPLRQGLRVKGKRYTVLKTAPSSIASVWMHPFFQPLRTSIYKSFLELPRFS